MLRWMLVTETLWHYPTRTNLKAHMATVLFVGNLEFVRPQRFFASSKVWHYLLSPIPIFEIGNALETGNAMLQLRRRLIPNAAARP